MLDKLSGYAKPEERILILAHFRHMRPASLEKAATRWPKLQIDFMTIHASKGQQADYVIIVDLQEGSDGFPAAAREWIMEEAYCHRAPEFPDAEERRCMYVALTRARHRLWALFNKENPSPFVEILKNLDVPVARKP
ncbi:3'-5' exonuclease [Escherichia coli]